MSTTTMIDDKLNVCALCEAKTFTRCSGCPDANVFFCSREHQKLLWPADKHLCGGPIDTCYFPPLTAKERAILSSEPKGPLARTYGVPPIRQLLKQDGLWYEEESFEALLSQLTKRDCPSSEPRRSRILALCLQQASDSSDELRKSPSVWLWVSVVHVHLAACTEVLKKEEGISSRPVHLLDFSDPQLDPFRRLNTVYRQALTVSALLNDISTQSRGGNFYPPARQYLLTSFSRLTRLIVDNPDIPPLQAHFLTSELSNMLGAAMGLPPSR